MRKRSQPRHGEGADRGCGERGGPEETHRLGGFDEHFALPELELVTVHVDGLQQVEDTLFLVPSPRRPGGFGQNGVPVRTMRERKIRLSLDHPRKAIGAARVLAIPSPPLPGLRDGPRQPQKSTGSGLPTSELPPNSFLI